jgi:hypothetical protein
MRISLIFKTYFILNYGLLRKRKVKPERNLGNYNSKSQSERGILEKDDIEYSRIFKHYKSDFQRNFFKYLKTGNIPKIPLYELA